MRAARRADAKPSQTDYRDVVAEVARSCASDRRDRGRHRARTHCRRPGIGFGKTPAQTSRCWRQDELLARRSVLTGWSRKSALGA
jgi:hypothetical protein